MEGFLTRNEADRLWLPSIFHPVRRHEVIKGYLAEFGVDTAPVWGPHLYTRTDLKVMGSQYEHWINTGNEKKRPKWLPQPDTSQEIGAVAVQPAINISPIPLLETVVTIEN